MNYFWAHIYLILKEVELKSTISSACSSDLSTAAYYNDDKKRERGDLVAQRYNTDSRCLCRHHVQAGSIPYDE